MIDLMIVGLYPAKNSTQIQDLVKSLKMNVQNEHVKRVVLVEEETPISDTRLETLLLPKVSVVNNKKRLTYQDAFEIANQMLEPGQTACLINSDCWLDDTVARLSKIQSWDKLFIALSRDARPIVYGADCWIFKTPITLSNVDVELGRDNCDCRVAAMAQRAGYTVLNPASTILLHHEHSHREAARSLPSVPPPHAFSILLSLEG